MYFGSNITFFWDYTGKSVRKVRTLLRFLLVAADSSETLATYVSTTLQGVKTQETATFVLM
jgi:hypothetical protein